MTQSDRPVQLGLDVSGVPDPRAALELATRAERLGFDHVVAGPAAAWDPWMLLTWLAARTERIALVAGLELAHVRPTVLARSAGSLDLLSGGRVTLALLSGTPAEPSPPTAHIGATAESVALVRRMWDTATPSAGAEPGPLPAHEIPIHLTGDEPAALEAAGTVADGWLGRLDPADPEALAVRIRMLDESALAAGRDPRELRRVVTVPSDAAATVPAGLLDQLTRAVTEHAATSFTLEADGDTTPDQLERFLRELGPLLQEAGQKALAGGVIAARPLRRTEVREKRRPGIDYDGLPDSLADTAVEPGDLGYAAARTTYLRGGAPGLVLRPRTPGDVSEAVAFARRHTHLPLGVRSGGHGLSGRSTNDGGLVIDVGALDEIEVLDEPGRLVRIGPGARWRQVATALQPHGWALTSGDYGGVGVGGLATAGGIGFLGRRHGLTIDHLRAVELVLADGSLVRATATERPELFWAVRGAGANFGIAVAFEFVVDEVPDVGWAQLAFQVSDPARFLVDFGRVTAAAPRETTPFLIMGPGTAQVMAMVASDDPEDVVAQLQPFAQIAPMVQQRVVIAPYAAVMNMFPDAPHAGRGEPVSRSGLVTALTPEVAEASARLISSGAGHWFQVRSMGGAIADVDPAETAFPHRDAGFQITVMGANAQRVDRWWDELRPHLSGLYLSFETDTAPERLDEAFGATTLARLRALKAEVDPTNLFRDNFNLTPTTSRSPR